MLGHNILDSGTSSTDKHFEEHMRYNRKESETWYEEEEKKAQPYLKLIHESSHVFKDSGRERGKKEENKKKKKILPSSISAKVKGALIMCCTHVFFSFCFLLTVFNVLSMLFLPLGGLCSAHTRHCLQGLLTVSQETLCSMGCTCTTLPRRPIHPHQLGSTHTLSVAQRCSQSPSKSTGNISGELDQIPTFPFTTFYGFFIAVSSIYLMAPPYEITQQEFLLYSNIWRLNNESCRHSFIKYKVALSAVQPWHFAE